VFDHLIENKERALIHCKYGFHRTGMLAYALMRLSGSGTKQAYRNLAHMRPVTKQEVGEDRI